METVLFTGSAALRGKLEALPAASGARIESEAGPALDLAGEEDSETACRAWLAAVRTC